VLYIYEKYMCLNLECVTRTGRIIPESPAELCNQLYVDDELLAVNGRDVSRMDHAGVVSVIKASGTTIQLTVQQPVGETHLLSLPCISMGFCRLCVCVCVCVCTCVCVYMCMCVTSMCVTVCVCTCMCVPLPHTLSANAVRWVSASLLAVC